ncbi:MAG: LysM peptidoglycan-binding domain-containing protein [Chloroflexi bacterium]|nr:MAG: LysM peptidoglycan-binding domain-containing protein [Chloroflexota bacterium]
MQQIRQPISKPVVKPKKHTSLLFWMLLFGVSLLLIILMSCGVLTLGVAVVYNNGILPGVSVGNISLGGLSQAEAIQKISEQWTTITLEDGERSWVVDSTTLGISLDAVATIERAYEQGRRAGSALNAIFSQVTVDPVLTINVDQLYTGLQAIEPSVMIPPVDASVQFIDGQVLPRPAQYGRSLDLSSTINHVQQFGLTDPHLQLMMIDIPPMVNDPTPIVNAATQLLTNPLIIRVYDPVTGDIVDWAAQPAEWATWITVFADPASPIGIRLSLSPEAVRDYLATRDDVLDASRYLQYDEATQAIITAVENYNLTPYIRVYHHDRVHVVRAGETITSIAWDYGVPYPYIEQANPGVGALSVGQEIIIPSPDNFLDYDPVPNKRIIVSISQQRVYVYEDGQLKWNWAASTGINSSPTWTGIYQILSHEPNAYASNWNLYMPWFMGVYRPVPGYDFTNGFHGFPTRGGGQILWENSLGTRVTYGCILLSNTNVQLLYNWAEDGVIVEIQP